MPTPTSPARRRAPSGPSRRAFLRNALAISWLGVLGGFGGATLAFLWPSLRGGFGAQLEVASQDAILEFIRERREPYPFPAGRAYLVEYDPADDPAGTYADITDGARVMALYQVCVHLGCKVPWCASSQWFECPCHGSRYNRWGEFEGSPAPRGLDRFAVTVDDGMVIIDTSTIIEGPTRQGGILTQPPAGPNCLRDT
jgi:cytochrome b6-f complex iron-sulfur subunit